MINLLKIKKDMMLAKIKNLDELRILKKNQQLQIVGGSCCRTEVIEEKEDDIE